MKVISVLVPVSPDEELITDHKPESEHVPSIEAASASAPIGRYLDRISSLNSDTTVFNAYLSAFPVDHGDSHQRIV